jgi:tRNA-specific 2-thiouridylase
VLGALEALKGDGFAVSLVAVGPGGEIDPAAVAAALRPDTVLVTLAAVNHELGTCYPLAALAEVARAGAALFHTDAVAAAGRVALDVGADGADAATISAHKIGGPKGVGAIYLRRGVTLAPLLSGGHQERDRRPGTENVAAIAGFGAAARAARLELPAVGARLRALRDRLEAGLLAVRGARRHGAADGRAPGTSNVAFDGVSGQLLAINLDLSGISVSTGAACTSGSLSPSPVLLALGLPPARAAEAVRVSLGRATGEGDIDRVIAAVTEAVTRLRAPGGGEAPARARRAARERVVVAMSGGVDSSTAAALLLDAGYEVVGVTLKLYNASGTSASIGGRCCGPRDIEDARATAAALGFPHYVIDETDSFRRAVIDDFVQEHSVGRTPNPCVRCNERLKFGPLLAFAEAVGASALATGHYARLTDADSTGRRSLLRAVDREKDQSYFLFGVRPEIFTKVRFPLGERTKEEVRALARRFALPNADKADSQEICFIPDGDHKGFVEARGGGGRAGAIRDELGAVIGQHTGTHHFTVGQRRGVPALGGGARRFVLRVEPSSGDVVVGPRASLGRPAMRVGDVRWLDVSDRDAGRRRCEVQIRHHAAPAAAWISGATADVDVEFDAPAYGVAPGQAAVFYDGDRVLGGGWIL